jgi:Zn2+/Cd2+-exporting ATPase
VPAQTYTIKGMDCASCALTLEKGVGRLEGVQNVHVDFPTSKMVVEGDTPLDAIRQRVQALGCSLAEDGNVGPQPATRTANKSRSAQVGGISGFWTYLLARRETRLALLGGALIVLAMLASFLSLPARNILLIAAMLITAYPIARSGINNLVINRDFNINLLMTIAAIGAVVIGEPLEGATVIFLFAIGEALEGYTADRARESLRRLIELAPAQALRLSDCGCCEEIVPVEALQIDDRILVKPGERIAMDGVVIQGTSSVNQAPITGESIPVHKDQGGEVFAGTINGDGSLIVRVTRLAADNTLSRIVQLVEQAQSARAPSQKLIDQIARVYTPAVVVMAALIAVLPPLLFGEPFYETMSGTHGWLYRALSLLVIACPCALVISSPVTIISAITAAARRGILIKGGVHLEALARVRAFALDKTGTLTRGEPQVTSSRALDCPTGLDCEKCDDVLALASAVERQSAHPLARAVVEEAKTRGLSANYGPAEAVEAMAGRGVRGRVNGKMVTVGSHELFDAEHPHTADFCSLVTQAEAQGQTTMLLCDGDRVRGFIAVADTVRADSQQVVHDLKVLGNSTIMLTGDNAIVAAAVGRALGVDDVRSGLLPAQKADAIKDLLDTNGSVAMVGDGVNDAPALATATVGIAMGGAGSAQAMETADIALMADDLRQLPFAIRLSRFARSLILQNVALSFAMKAIFVVLALAGGASLWMAILADVGMSLLVTLNGMRPLRFRLR